MHVLFRVLSYRAFWLFPFWILGSYAISLVVPGARAFATPEFVAAVGLSLGVSLLVAFPPVVVAGGKPVRALALVGGLAAMFVLGGWLDFAEVPPDNPIAAIGRFMRAERSGLASAVGRDTYLRKELLFTYDEAWTTFLPGGRTWRLIPLDGNAKKAVAWATVWDDGVRKAAYHGSLKAGLPAGDKVRIQVLQRDTPAKFLLWISE